MDFETWLVILLLIGVTLPLTLLAVRARPALEKRVACAGWLVVVAAITWGAASYAPPVLARAPVTDRPIETAHGGYVSSRACKACHPEEYATWHRSYHRTMTQSASTDTVVGPIDGVVVQSRGRPFALERRGKQVWVEMDDPETLDAAPDSVKPRESPRVWREIVQTTGSHSEQFYWISSGQSRKLTLLPIMYRMLDEKRWASLDGCCISEPNAIQESANGRWNRVCNRCHATHTLPGIEVDEGTMDTRVAELGIACEACHGPAEKHIERYRDPRERYARHAAKAGTRAGSETRANKDAGAESHSIASTRASSNANPSAAPSTHPRVDPSAVSNTDSGAASYAESSTVSNNSASTSSNDESIQSSIDDSIINPAKLSKERSSEVCGQCHGIHVFKNDADRADWRKNGFRYRPGEVLADSAPLSESGEDRFWSDGMIRVSGREYNGLVKSPCFMNGEMTCLSCHSMHKDSDDTRSLDAWSDDQLHRGMDGDRACTQCHAQFPTPDKITAHTHHSASSSGSTCMNCHMPYTTYGLLKGIRSHQVSSPSVQESLATGRPNACNGCHLDRTLAWTAEKLEHWYKIEPPALSDDQRSFAAGVLWTLQGDAGQRALMAWSMGWDAARKASGSDWMTPYLTVMVQDPYRAVRYIAHRSLGRQLDAAAMRGSDPLAQPAEQFERTKPVLQAWGARTHLASPALLINERGEIDLALFQRLMSKRNERAVVLNE